MIKTNPFLKLADVRSEYVFSHVGRNLLEIYESKVFGGCIYNKIGKKKGGYITHYLEKKVKNYNI
jgi:hypothetical protein